MLWKTALKVIPWGDVIDAAPALVKGARKIFTRSQETEAHAEAAVDAAGTPEQAPLQQRVAQLEESLAQVTEQQKAAAQLIETLAEQNARVVQAIEVLRVRTRLLIGACGVLTAALVGVLIWVAQR